MSVFAFKYVLPIAVALFLQLSVYPVTAWLLQEGPPAFDLVPRRTGGELTQHIIATFGLGAMALAFSFPISVAVIWLVTRFWLMGLHGMPKGAGNWWMKQALISSPAILWAVTPLVFPDMWIMNYGTVPSVAGLAAIPLLALLTLATRKRRQA